MTAALKLKGRKLYSGQIIVAEITGWRQTASRNWGPYGPGYGYTLFTGEVCEPCYAYFRDAVTAARAAVTAARAALPSRAGSLTHCR